MSSYSKGDWLAICDSCGRKVKASTLKLRWDGLRVCTKDWETRHPQDYVRAKVDIQAVPWTRPETTDTFIALALNSSILDSVRVFGGGGDTVQYIDPTYFLSDYLYNGAVEPEFILLFGKSLTETVAHTESGTAIIEPYIDPTYFLSDYIRTVAVTI